MQSLSDFDQASIRSYTQIALTFPLAQGTSTTAVIQHLRSSLARLGEKLPFLAGRVRLRKTRFGEEAYISPGNTGDIPLRIAILAGQQFNVAEVVGSSYAKLAARGFPAHAFVHPALDLNDDFKIEEKPVPVAHVRVSVVTGGLILLLSLHHTAGDGYSLQLFADSFAAATRRERIPGENLSLDLKLPNEQRPYSATLLDLSRTCPEFNILLNPNSSPGLEDTLPGGVPIGAIPKTGKIFVFDFGRLQKLRDMVYMASGPETKRPTVFACLAAFTWAHVTRARLKSEVGFAPKHEDSNEAKLFIPVDFRGQFSKETEVYFGNAVVTVPTRASVSEVESACDGKNLKPLATLLAKVAATISGVDEAAVLRREDLFSRIGDCRRLVLRQDRRIPGQLQFNTWRFMGGDTSWSLPGVGTKRKPDSIRRIQGDLSIGNALILPARSDSKVYELFLQIPTISMELLLEDMDWMRWVEKVVG
ncbi:hypothetical protein J7T55_003421 [Diaporthe amygdali]|uniref:uncharacterized protein n=1 Tax=Phomopsis amygdali TaxID=1214568 RepID=UPI0022FE3B8D|nr:uncharacterized protein J7T55_003421 [Diaporthe amygdali]KAJ0117006.1 hypothetical protein J7T55_003421 [Diaporthe amygdali]